MEPGRCRSGVSILFRTVWLSLPLGPPCLLIPRRVLDTVCCDGWENQEAGENRGLQLRGQSAVSREGPGERLGDIFPDCSGGTCGQMLHPWPFAQGMTGIWGSKSDEALCTLLGASLLSVAVSLLFGRGQPCGGFGSCCQVSSVLSSI